MGTLLSLALAATFAAQSQPDNAVSEDFLRANSVWGHCVTSRAQELATGPTPVEMVVENAQIACRDAEQRVRDILTTERGADFARDVIAFVLTQGRELIRRQVLEARGISLNDPRSANFALGQCVGQYSLLAARTTDKTPEQIADDALQHCSAEMQAVRAWAMSNGEQVSADRYIDSVRQSLRESVLSRVNEMRVSR